VAQNDGSNGTKVTTGTVPTAADNVVVLTSGVTITHSASVNNIDGAKTVTFGATDTLSFSSGSLRLPPGQASAAR
jgi:hypothetical protein